MAFAGMPVDHCSYVHEPVSCEAYDFATEAYDFAPDAITLGSARFEGDYYAADETNVLRGLTMPALQGESYDSSLQCCGKMSAVHDMADDAHFEYPICQGMHALPASSFLLDVSQDEAFEALERHFNTEEVAHIAKLRPTKGCLTVQVSHQGGHWAAQCEIKVRLYPNCSQATSLGSLYGLAVVFERREGDALAFAQIFRRVRAALQAPSAFVACFPAEETSPADCAADVDVGREAMDELTVEEMQPLMDMMSDMQPASVQIAALNALVTFALPTGKMPAIVCQALRSNESLLANLLTKTAFEFACLGSLVAAALTVESFSECFARTLLAIASDRVQEGVADQKMHACWATVLRGAASQLPPSEIE
eukprot:TRINITY_DN70_c0_g2_i1.p1 TRINITY_DN70_c0_g2~~TRINITY_DN70_c0_g2_i1.p1  ORF type:complete len:366 (-),score=61.64 TRINITY_DN70_c0_g2_i1:504-1601(-)